MEDLLRSALLFPGQGAQAVGMGRDLADASAAAREVFARADEVLDLPLSRLCFEGPQEALTATDVAQPAIYTTSLAGLAALEERLGRPLEPSAAAGLSLGEYTALTAAGALSFEDGLRLVRQRGAAMQAASEARPSGMTSVLGLAREALEELCAAVADETGLVCQVANLNAPGQVVVSGELGALDVLESRAKEAGARRALRLDVAGAFHSEVMRPAADELARALEDVAFGDARCPVWQNATAVPATEAAVLRENLAAQLCAPVLWEESFRGMAEAVGETPFLEPPPGRVLAGLARKIVPGTQVKSLADTAALEALTS